MLLYQKNPHALLPYNINNMGRKEDDTVISTGFMVNKEEEKLIETIIYIREQQQV